MTTPAFSTPRRPATARLVGTLALGGAILSTLLSTSGCMIPGIIGAVGNEIERNKKLEVLAQYDGLENRTVAIVVHADASTLYEYPQVVVNVAANVGFRIQREVEGVSVLAPATVIQWQYATPAWSTLPYGDIADELGVDRVVFIDIYEFRLNPPGNQYMWEGVAAGTVGVIERESADRDMFAASFDVRTQFPLATEPIPREAATAQAMLQGVMTKFVQKSAWLFYTHLEDKYPDKQM
jgi:hypothetical protein